MKPKKFDVNYWITLLFLLATSEANFIATSDIAWFVVMLIMFLVAVTKKVILKKDIKVLAIFSAIYLGFVGIRYLVNVNLISGLDYSYLLSDAAFLIKFIYFTWLFCVILKDKVAVNIITVMADLTVLSFFLYGFQLIAGDYIYNFSKSLNLPSNNMIPGYTNFILFSFTKGYHDYRNSGFVWEPGSFGCFLVIALMLNLFLNKFRFDKKSIIFAVAVITTFSTTSYLGLSILLFLAYRYRVPKITPQVVMIISLFVALFVFVPFLGNKVFDSYYEDMADVHRLKSLAPFYKSINMSFVPLNRFGSMAYIYNTFGADLVLGVGNKYDIILNRNLNVNISNGVFDFFARLGIVGYIYLMYRYTKFCAAFVIKPEYIIYCFLVLFALSFGEPILSLPFVMIFIFIPLTQKNMERARPGGLPAI